VRIAIAGAASRLGLACGSASARHVDVGVIDWTSSLTTLLRRCVQLYGVLASIDRKAGPTLASGSLLLWSIRSVRS
jgi:hypothetical protein